MAVTTTTTQTASAHAPEPTTSPRWRTMSDMRAMTALSAGES